ncbi:hypothetical protein Halru_0986 [Halovivax ruber XH-70]|uniref:CHAT domain-containing protein n=1 Tax=Halovivax ruber (strain DSM 18193 / JCM 13892 / XH-70) TaxID=797302 RepID=L0I7P0_HALRX|nr:hypothetical protein [Halovivax ruber]AGB15605.1 hypothetical protein Halru_0986 [Halovivax ruber XH-70]
MVIEISPLTDPHGLRLFDSNEQRQLSIKTSGEITPKAVSTEEFCFPVDTACRVETSSLVFDQRYLVNVHDQTGRSIAKLNDNASYQLADDVQFVGLDGPMKLYCRIPTSGRIEIGIKSVQFTFDECVEIDIGARSLHERPAGRIETPAEPRTMMRAISSLTSALKTESPERSWPTLRGHPPRIELASEFSVQTENDPLRTNVRIEIPADYEHLYPIAPLSFYLGATVVAGDTPTVRVGDRSFELGASRTFEDDVSRTLQQLFFLDCIVRTEGIYPYQLHERNQLESALPWDLAELYNRSLTERIKAYLAIEYELVEPHLPRWPLTAHVPPEPESVELLPYIVNELGIVRTTAGTRTSIETSIPEPKSARTPVSMGDTSVRAASTSSVDTGPFTRSRTRSQVSRSNSSSTFPVVEPAVTDESIEHAWFGDLAPKSGSKATIEAYRNQLDRESRTEHIDILVVCNDARMLDEHDLLDDTYGSRELLPFDVTSRFGVTTDELADLLESGGFDFLHYIGHATEDGLECTDGDLDVRSLETVDLGVFFLNACHSYEQGLALSRRGAFGGVATIGDIINEHAVESGASLAKLLNLGFPLRGALEMLSEWTILGDQYLIVGDGSTDIAQSDGGAPTVVTVESDVISDTFDVSFRHYPAKEFQIGSVTSPTIESINEVFLLPMTDYRTEVTADQLREYVTWTETPVLTDTGLEWNTDLGFPRFLEN